MNNLPTRICGMHCLGGRLAEVRFADLPTDPDLFWPALADQASSLLGVRVIALTSVFERYSCGITVHEVRLVQPGARDGGGDETVEATCHVTVGPDNDAILASPGARDIIAAAKGDGLPLTADEYARERARLGLDDLFDGPKQYNVEFGDPQVGEVGVHLYASLILARRRFRAVKQEREEAKRVAHDAWVERRVAELTPPQTAGEIVRDSVPWAVSPGDVIGVRGYPHRVVSSRRFVIDEDEGSFDGRFVGCEGYRGSRIEAEALPLDEARAWLRGALRKDL